MASGADLLLLMPVLVAGTLMLALAVALLYLGAANRANRAFALLLAARGVLNVGLFTGELMAADRFESLVWGIGVAATPFAALYFLLVYRHRSGTAPLGRLPPLVLLAGALAAEAAFLAHVFTGPGDNVETGGRLNSFISFAYLCYALVASVLARDALRTRPGPVRSSLIVVSLGFGLGAVFLLIVEPLSLALRGGSDDYFRPDSPVRMIGLAATVAGLSIVAHLLWTLWRARDAAQAWTRGYLVALVVALASGVAQAALEPFGQVEAGPVFRIFDGLWTLSMPVLVGFALVRYQLFDVDVKARWTIKQGTIAAVVIAVFFIASEVAQQFFGDTTGSTYLGILVAGCLVFAAAPLQRLAERVSDQALPHAKPIKKKTADERLRLYTELVELAWADGHMDKADRSNLMRFRSRLGLSSSDAERIEQSVVAA